MTWREECIQYWRKYAPLHQGLLDSISITPGKKPVTQFCNEHSFRMAMRLKYNTELEDATHAWSYQNRECLQSQQRRQLDFLQYVDECIQLNQSNKSKKNSWDSINV